MQGLNARTDDQMKDSVFKNIGNQQKLYEKRVLIKFHTIGEEKHIGCCCLCLVCFGTVSIIGET